MFLSEMQNFVDSMVYLFLICFSYRRFFSKGSNQWLCTLVKERKTYYYIPDLILKIITSYCTNYKEKPLRTKLVLEEDDPRLLSETIAPTEPPPTKELVEQRQSRLKLSWPKPEVSTKTKETL